MSTPAAATLTPPSTPKPGISRPSDSTARDGHTRLVFPTSRRFLAPLTPVSTQPACQVGRPTLTSEGCTRLVFPTSRRFLTPLTPVSTPPASKAFATSEGERRLPYPASPRFLTPPTPPSTPPASKVVQSMVSSDGHTRLAYPASPRFLMPLAPTSTPPASHSSKSKTPSPIHRSKKPTSLPHPSSRPSTGLSSATVPITGDPTRPPETKYSPHFPFDSLPFLGPSPVVPIGTSANVKQLEAMLAFAMTPSMLGALGGREGVRDVEGVGVDQPKRSRRKN